ncbi:class I SAM-dependent DNA methyltransferase [Nostoc sp.]|uniref:class I SAM-dependent DNA methyltransferase n=1 Tax=Nostoc sp. TaxID=1180 RepID=UPI002FF8F98A
MSVTYPIPDYDKYARLQNKSKDENYINLVMGHLEKLMLRHIPEKAHIFDLCCGTGQFLREFEIRGYQTTGLDGSEGLLHYARENAPSSKLIIGDARYFELSPIFHAVFSQMSLNMIITLEDLRRVFHNVYIAMLENGIFLFNLIVQDWSPIENRIGATEIESNEETVSVTQNYSHPEERVRETKCTTFELIDGKLQRSDNNWLVKHYQITEITSALEMAGFIEINCYNSHKDLGVELGVSESRTQAIFVCRKPVTPN